jgi:hypothetical protein
MAKGIKTGGGSRKGKPNKATAAKAAAVAASGLTPLDYLLSVMRNESNDIGQRIDAAKAAALYVHPKLQPVDGKTGDSAVVHVGRVELVDLDANGADRSTS